MSRVCEHNHQRNGVCIECWKDLYVEAIDKNIERLNHWPAVPVHNLADIPFCEDFKVSEADLFYLEVMDARMLVREVEYELKRSFDEIDRLELSEYFFDRDRGQDFWFLSAYLGFEAL